MGIEGVGPRVAGGFGLLPLPAITTTTTTHHFGVGGGFCKGRDTYLGRVDDVCGLNIWRLGHKWQPYLTPVVGCRSSACEDGRATSNLQLLGDACMKEAETLLILDFRCICSENKKNKFRLWMSKLSVSRSDYKRTTPEQTGRAGRPAVHLWFLTHVRGGILGSN